MSARTDSFFIRPKQQGLGIDMAPLIDIVFLLLIFFMLNTTFSNPAIPMVLPKSSSSASAVHENEVLVVSCDAEGRIYINREEVELSDYTGKLKAAMDERGLKSVHFKGDENLPYKRYMQIVGASTAAGVEQWNNVQSPQETSAEEASENQ
jgi:biopolymer transport protein ExbD